MEVVSCLQGRSNPVFSFLLFIFLCSLWSCTSEDTVTLSFAEVQSPQNHAIHKIEFVDDNRAYALGGNRYMFGIAQFSSDGGTSWSLDTIGEKTIRDFEVDQDEIFSAGYRGYYYSTDTLTNIWKVSRPGDAQNIHGVARQVGIQTVVGGISFKNGFIKRLDENQNMVSELIIEEELSALIKTSDQTLHAVGYGVIYRSQDNGLTWVPSNQSGDNYQDVFFISDAIGWIVGQAGSILKTADGGDSWSVLRKPTAHSKENLIKIHFTDEDHGLVVGEKGIVWRTQNGGDSWDIVDNLPDYDYTAVHVRGDVAWIASQQGAILKVFLE